MSEVPVEQIQKFMQDQLRLNTIVYDHIENLRDRLDNVDKRTNLTFMFVIGWALGYLVSIGLEYFL